MDCTSRNMTELSSQLMYVDALHSLTQAIAALSVSCLLPPCPARAFLRLSRNSFCRIQTRHSYNQTLWWQTPTLEKTCHYWKHSLWLTRGNQNSTRGGLFTPSPDAAATSRPAGTVTAGGYRPLQTPNLSTAIAAAGDRANHSTEIQTSKEVEKFWNNIVWDILFYELLTVKEHM